MAENAKVKVEVKAKVQRCKRDSMVAMEAQPPSPKHHWGNRMVVEGQG